MQIKQAKQFKPLTITLDTQEEYDDFFRIVEEAIFRSTVDQDFMTVSSTKMAFELSTFATNNR
jgi:hypothetical protein